MLFTSGMARAPFGIAGPTRYLPHPHLAQFVETACYNQGKDDMQFTIRLIKHQINAYSSGQFMPLDHHLLLVLMATYIGTLKFRTSLRNDSSDLTRITAMGIEVNDLEGDRDFKQLHNILFHMQQNFGTANFFGGSVSCNELNRYKDFLSVSGWRASTGRRARSPPQADRGAGSYAVQLALPRDVERPRTSLRPPRNFFGGN